MVTITVISDIDFSNGLIKSKDGVYMKSEIIICKNKLIITYNEQMVFVVLFQTLAFQVKVTTEDGERSTSKTIVIEVQDINDNSPEFEYPVSLVNSMKRIPISIYFIIIEYYFFSIFVNCVQHSII